MGLKLNALGVLNSESTSFSFDDRANGYGRGEGVGAVVLKRMSDALRDGDSEFNLIFYVFYALLGNELV